MEYPYSRENASLFFRFSSYALHNLIASHTSGNHSITNANLLFQPYEQRLH